MVPGFLLNPIEFAALGILQINQPINQSSQIVNQSIKQLENQSIKNQLDSQPHFYCVAGV